MSERQITNRIRKLRELEEQKATLEKDIAKVKAEIQAEMQDTEQLRVGAFLVRWTKQISKRLDGNMLKLIHPDIYLAYTKNTESRRFSIVEA